MRDDDLENLLKIGALVAVGKDKYIVNYIKMYAYAPELVEEFALADLNEFEKEAYRQGYVCYDILPSGRLLWKRTLKKFK